MAAHRRAVEINRHGRTSVAHTYFMLGEHAVAIQEDLSGEVGYMRAQALATLGREAEALDIMREKEPRFAGKPIGNLVRSLRLLLEGEIADGTRVTLDTVRVFSDGEGVYYLARQLARYAAPDDALSALERAVDLGYFCKAGIEADPWMSALHGRPRFDALMERISAAHRRAQSIFGEAGGLQLLHMER